MNKHIDLLKLEAFKIMLHSQVRLFDTIELDNIEHEQEKIYINKIISNVKTLSSDLDLIVGFYKDQDIDPVVLQKAGVNFLNTQALLNVAPMVGDEHKLVGVTEHLRQFLSTTVEAIKAIDSLFYLFVMGTRTNI